MLFFSGRYMRRQWRILLNVLLRMGSRLMGLKFSGTLWDSFGLGSMMMMAWENSGR